MDIMDDAEDIKKSLVNLHEFVQEHFRFADGWESGNLKGAVTSPVLFLISTITEGRACAYQPPFFWLGLSIENFRVAIKEHQEPELETPWDTVHMIREYNGAFTLFPGKIVQGKAKNIDKRFINAAGLLVTPLSRKGSFLIAELESFVQINEIRLKLCLLSKNPKKIYTHRIARFFIKLKKKIRVVFVLIRLRFIFGVSKFGREREIQ